MLHGCTYVVVTPQVYEDGYISLNGPASVTTPQSFPFSSSYPMIAPFWIDGVRTGDVFYREATDSLLLMRATNEIRFTYGTDFVPTSLFIVTWSGITDGVSSSPVSWHNIAYMLSQCCHVPILFTKLFCSVWMHHREYAILL